jgi:hypothetical protein
MTWKIETDNTSITELTWVAAGPAAGWHLNRVNDTAHLLLAGLTGKLQQEQQGGSQPTEAATAAAASVAEDAEDAAQGDGDRGLQQQLCCRNNAAACGRCAANNLQ